MMDGWLENYLITATLVTAGRVMRVLAGEDLRPFLTVPDNLKVCYHADV